MAFATINKGASYFDTQLWTGNNGNGRTFTGLDFQPNLIWSKCYDSANYNHVWVDRVRGGNYFLFSNSTLAEDNKSHGEITSWNSDGTTWANGTNVTYPRAYYNDGSGSALGGSTYVSWNWKAGDSAGSSNTNGSITSTVSANTTAGFSIVAYTGSGAAATVGHGLGVVPKAIIIKSRSNAVDWINYFSVLGSDKFLKLNLTDVTGTSTGVWNNTAPTSSVFSINSSGTNNDPGVTYVAYCFAEIKGYSKFGSWISNGSSTADAFVYTGFKPAWVMMKMSSSANSWFIYDNKRVTYNADNSHLIANTTAAAGTNTSVDFYSNGFRSNGLYNSYSGQTIVYMAFAENPFVLTDGTPVTAR